MSLPLSQIPVAILAGGLATRRRPITELPLADTANGITI